MIDVSITITTTAHVFVVGLQELTEPKATVIQRQGGGLKPTAQHTLTVSMHNTHMNAIHHQINSLLHPQHSLFVSCAA